MLRILGFHLEPKGGDGDVTTEDAQIVEVQGEDDDCGAAEDKVVEAFDGERKGLPEGLSWRPQLHPQEGFRREPRGWRAGRGNAVARRDSGEQGGMGTWGLWIDLQSFSALVLGDLSMAVKTAARGGEVKLRAWRRRGRALGRSIEGRHLPRSPPPHKSDVPAS